MKRFSSEEIKDFVSKELFGIRNYAIDKSYPRIAIVTPSYNQARYLEKTILSVLNQGYPNLEYIIIDGGSTDGSIEIIKKYEKYIAYWVSERDKGQSDALNKGFKLATGEIIGWQNSDDVYLPGAFEVAAKNLTRSPSALIFGNVYLIDATDSIIRDIRYVPFSLNSLLYEGWNITNQAVFWKKELFSRFGYLDSLLQYGMDYDWFVRLGKEKVAMQFLRMYLGCFRLHEKTKGSTQAHIGKKEYMAIKERQGFLKRNRIRYLMSLARRLALYLIQGDLDYLTRGIFRRIKNLIG